MNPGLQERPRVSSRLLRRGVPTALALSGAYWAAVITTGVLAGWGPAFAVGAVPLLVGVVSRVGAWWGGQP